MGGCKDLTSVPVRILGICASPRAGSNTEIILGAALENARSVGGVDTVEFKFHRRKILPCLHCGACKKARRCTQKDDFHELFNLWLEADAVIYATPVYHMGITGQLKCAIDRLGHVLFSTYDRRLPRILKVGGAITQGNCRYGGQETAMVYLIQHMLTMNCIPVSGDTPDSYIGAGGMVPNRQQGGILEDAIGLSAARSLGRRVAEVAKIVRAGVEALEDSLPPEYTLWRSDWEKGCHRVYSDETHQLSGHE